MSFAIYPVPHPLWRDAMPTSRNLPAIASPVLVVLETAAGVTTATLALTAPGILILSSSDGISSATLDVSAPSLEPIWAHMGPSVLA